MQAERTVSHRKEKTVTTYLFALYRQQTRTVKGRIVRGKVNGKIRLIRRSKSQSPIGIADDQEKKKRKHELNYETR